MQSVSQTERFGKEVADFECNNDEKQQSNQQEETLPAILHYHLQKMKTEECNC
jgi:hypothetical protein